MSDIKSPNDTFKYEIPNMIELGIDVKVLPNNYDITVITKSTKDRLAIRCWWKANKSLYGGVSIGLINIPHETYKLRQNEYDWLTSKLSATGRIISTNDLTIRR